MAKKVFLDFEQPIAELEAKIEELRYVQTESAVDISTEIDQLSKKSQQLTKDIYSDLTPWQITKIARHAERPYTLDYIHEIFTDFQELHGDRHFADDLSIVGGLARFNGTACMVLVIPTSIPVNNAKELVEWIKKQEAPAAYAAVTGSSQHIAAELLAKRAGLKATLVPYRGSAQAQPDLIAGRIVYMFDNLPSALPQARAGKVKALAQTCATRSPSAPELPTMVEAGFADFVVDGWYGMFAPVKTPKAIVDKLSADINKALKDPDSLEKWKALGFDPIGSTPAEFAKRQKDDLAYWKKMIEYTGVKVE